MNNYTHWFLRARLKTRQLLLLQALDEEGNIHRAAEVLSMTQPAASKLLKDLEDVLGVSLFDRLPRGMRPTWYGEAMIRHARMALNSLNQAYDEVQAIKAGRFGLVSVGAITAPALSLLPAAMTRVKQQHPTLRVNLQIETSDVLLERLLQGKLDMFVGRLFERHDSTDLRYTVLGDEPVSAMVRPGHPLLQRAQPLTLRDLSGMGWMVPPSGGVLRHRWELMFQEEGLPVPDNLIETTALLFITGMLEQSDMISVAATTVVDYYARHGMVERLPIRLPCTMDSYGIVTRAEQLLSPAAEVMMKALQETAALPT
jgi:DNA-binding transcriptional LysR family regulator